MSHSGRCLTAPILQNNDDDLKHFANCMELTRESLVYGQFVYFRHPLMPNEVPLRPHQPQIVGTAVSHFFELQFSLFTFQVISDFARLILEADSNWPQGRDPINKKNGTDS